MGKDRLTVEDIRKVVDSLRRSYILACNPADVDGAKHTLKYMNLGPLITVEVKGNRLLPRGQTYLISASTPLFGDWADKEAK